MNSGPQKQSFASRAYRALLKLFPFDFRGDFGDEMEEVFQEQHADAQKSKRKLGVLRLWWDTTVDIFRTAPREHVEMLRQDAGYALRMMRKNMAFTVAAVVTLALGIGANTAIFSVVYGVLLKPLPYGEGQPLVRMWQEARARNFNNIGFSEKELADYRQQAGSITSLVEYHNMNFILLGGEEPVRVNTGVVSPEFFGMFGVKPILGRDFRADDDHHGAEAVLLLSHSFWQRQFGGDRSVVNRVFRMNDRPHRVVGVLPPLPLYPDENDVWMPVSSCPFRSAQQTRENRNARMMRVFGRLAPGATLADARSELTTIASRQYSEYPANYPKAFDFGISAETLHAEMTAGARPTFMVLLAATGFVLLIACSNVANLTLARLLRRERELSMRAALGASRTRLMRQMLTESTVLAVIGGALGLAIAASSTELLAQFAARFTPRAGEVTLDMSVMLFTLLISVFTGLLFGSLPAMASARHMFASLRDGGRTSASVGRSRMRSVLLGAQVAFSFVLLMGAGLMLRSFVKLLQVDAGFSNDDKVLSARLTMNFSHFTGPEQTREFYKSLFEKLDAHPEIVSKAALSTIPLSPGVGRFNTPFQVEGREVDDPAQRPVLDQRITTPDYFRTVGIPLLRGRYFTEFDHDKSERVCIINQSMAQRYWPNEDPIGKRIIMGNADQHITIVGVVGNVRTYGLDQQIGDEAFIPLAQGAFANSIFVRTNSDPLRVADAVRQAVYATNSTVPIDRIQTLERVKSESLANPRLTAGLMALFAGLALLITAAGIGGVMAVTVSQRTHEIGIRLALGASPARVQRMVLRQGLTVVVVGLALGIGAAVWLSRLMERLLFGVEPTDPVTFAAVSAVLLLCAAVACWLPARRAASIDPMIALRAE